MKLRAHKRRAAAGMARRIEAVGPVHIPWPGVPPMKRRLCWRRYPLNFNTKGIRIRWMWVNDDGYVSSRPFSAASLGVKIEVRVMPSLS